MLANAVVAAGRVSAKCRAGGSWGYFAASAVVAVSIVLCRTFLSDFNWLTSNLWKLGRPNEFS